MKSKLLYEAWQNARLSDASSPGVPIAYHELVEDGIKYPGERPWQVRWDYLKDCADFEGKSILELGCNMGLLSCFLLKEKGARRALCVDGDPHILCASQLVAAAYGVAPFYRQVNFDDERRWEEEISWFAPDVVFALSVLNWVQDKDRFLRFLSRFDRVIFEGHDDKQDEYRLNQFGFATKRIAVSERGRSVLRCTKSHAP